MSWWWLALALGWDEIGENGRPNGRTWSAADRFVSATLGGEGPVGVETDPGALGRVAARTAEAIRTCRREESCTAGAFAELGVTMDRVLATLDLVARVADEDRGAAVQRLLDPAWLAQHFDVFHWLPDQPTAARRQVVVTDQAIRLTNYLVYEVSGSPVRTSVYDTALYASPRDGSRAWEAYDRVQIYAGAFEPGGSAPGLLEPLVWVTREGSNHALMQGTIEVKLPDGRRQLYNVDRNNGVPYNAAQKNGDLQRRFWTFRRVEGVLGVEGVALEPWVAVAGDIHNVGFGKLIALEAPGVDGGSTLRLAVLADTGGAFQPNLYQLDWLAGSYPSHAAYEAHVAHLPRRVAASILVAR